jgi:hypothetical protein
MNLTQNFTIQEVNFSSTADRLGIDNTLPAALWDSVLKTAVGMEKVRAALGNKPVSIDSWYRCLELNRALKSKDTSQHLKGEAVDFICPTYGTPTQIAKFLLTNQSLIRWDQLILEHSWIHISWNSSNPNSGQRGEVLSLLSTGGYSTGLTDSSGVAV